MARDKERARSVAGPAPCESPKTSPLTYESIPSREIDAARLTAAIEHLTGFALAFAIGAAWAWLIVGVLGGVS